MECDETFRDIEHLKKNEIQSRKDASNSVGKLDVLKKVVFKC